MPMYEYVCTACGTQSEHLVFSDSEAPVCPSCGSDRLERRMSAFAVSSSPDLSAVPSCPSGTCCPGGTCGF